MNYQESVAFIESLAPMVESPSLARIKAFLSWHGSIQNEIPTIHVGGTNGKGSTATIVDSLLQALGLKVGRFIGPHLLRWNERLNINARAIDDERFAELVTRVKGLSEKFAGEYPDLGPLSWFEILTAMAFIYFKEEGCDYQVLEVGLGGNFDATNAADNVCGTIITNVDLDHTQILGDTVEKIASEKAGIIKPGIPVFTQARGAALDEILRQAAQMESRVYSGDAPPASGTLLAGVIREHLDELLDSISLRGPHQRNNGRLALFSLSLIEDLDRPVAALGEQVVSRLKDGLSRIYWPGRLQTLHTNGNENDIILDGAHNPASARVLRVALDQLGLKRCCFVLGFYRSKDAEGFLKSLPGKDDRVIACRLHSRRSAYSPEAIMKMCKDLGVSVKTVESVAEGIEEALASRLPGETIVATGSFAVLKETMELFGWQSVDMGTPLGLT
ncbi:MAG: bifunctional folylpolyglutamate synthase/dihydrofolate synthase [Cyanobacteria bacterium HKST-UBA02]|nr:bifunctional folylpolyglutamate synthase/dihydrofolate synthase [Cyanobacteria bacterium HKST-UBA02]